MHQNLCDFEIIYWLLDCSQKKWIGHFTIPANHSENKTKQNLEKIPGPCQKAEKVGE